MLHYTLNTGHTRTSPRSEVADDVIAKMLPVLATGTHELWKTFGPVGYGYGLIVTEDRHHLLAGLTRNGINTISMLVVADDDTAEIAWPAIERSYLKMTERSRPHRMADWASPHRPATAPWVSVAIIQPMLVPDWAGDFERCLAWTWLDSRHVTGGSKGDQ